MTVGQATQQLEHEDLGGAQGVGSGHHDAVLRTQGQGRPHKAGDAHRDGQARLTFTLCTLIRFPQLSRYCLRSFSCNEEHPSASSSLPPLSPVRTPASLQRTRYSKTSVRERSVWMMSCRVTMLACLRFFSSDTAGTGGSRLGQLGARWDIPKGWGQEKPLPHPQGLTFPDSGAWSPFLVLQADLLQCHQVFCQLAASLEDSGISALQGERGHEG